MVVMSQEPAETVPLKTIDFVRRFKRLNSDVRGAVMELLTGSMDDLCPSSEDLEKAYEGVAEDVRVKVSERINVAYEERLKACRNIGDFVGRFNCHRPGNRVYVQYDDVWVRYNWDPLDIGQDFGLECRMSFKGDSVNITARPKQSLGEILAALGIEMSYDTLKKALRTVDWYMHTECTENDEVLFYFHNYYNSYDFGEIESMLNNFVDCFVDYLKLLKGIPAGSEGVTVPEPRLPGYN